MCSTRTRLFVAAAAVAALLMLQTPSPAVLGAQEAAPPPQNPAAGAPPAAPGAPVQETAQPVFGAQQPTFRTGIDFVRVDVIVTERGQPVTNLTEADFEVREDGRVQAIEQFRLIKVDGTPRPGDPAPRVIRSRDDEELEAGRDDVRVIVFFLDDYHTRLASSIAIKATLNEFITTQLRPTDMIAVMTPLAPASELRLTRNHGGVMAQINQFEGRKFRYQPRNQFEQQYSQQSTDTVEMIRNQVVMGALRGLSTRLGAVREGRKTIIYVSEGFTVLLPPQMRGQVAELANGLPNPAAAGAVDNSPQENTAMAFAMGDITQRLRDVYDAANRNNVAIYPLDPRGLAATEFGADENIGPQQDRAALRATQDTLRMVAENTDGRAIINRNDLGRGLQQAMQDSSYYYLIGYTSSAPTDGRFHEVKVNVKRGGVAVRARRGFWAATADDLERATKALTPGAGPSRAVETALASIAPAVRNNQYIRTWLGSTRGENGRTRVTLLWEALPAPAGTRREVAGRVGVIAARESGELLFRGRSNGDAAAAPAAASVPQRIEFDAPPGAMELRLAIEAATGGLIDNEIRTVQIPDLGSASTALSTPRVYRARTARELQAIMQDPAAVPTVGREFSRAERLLIRFDVYSNGGEIPNPTAVLLNRAGQKVLDVPVSVATGGGTHQIDLGLNQVPSAEYLIEITVNGQGGEAKELVPLRVGS